MDISVIIPVYNEEENLPVLYERLKKVLHDQKLQHELLFVNDGSQDASLERIHALAARDPAVKYIDFSRNFGHQIAVTAGLESCRGKAVVIMDADLQDPPEVVPELYAKWKEGYEVVAARRRARQCPVPRRARPLAQRSRRSRRCRCPPCCSCPCSSSCA